MIKITENKDLHQMTTFGLPAECGRLVEYDANSDLPELQAKGILNNALILGGGSNMLFTDGHFNGTVVCPRTNEVNFESIGDKKSTVHLYADAGVILDDLCHITTEKSLWGLENLSGIPGTIGGASVQNVGAYGVEFKDIVSDIYCFSISKGEFFSIPATKCDYGYRSSVFKTDPLRTDVIITRARIRLSLTPDPRLDYRGLADALKNIPHEQLTPQQIRQEVMRLRDGKLPSPSTTGSAGSFFKNPVVSVEEFAKITERWEKLSSQTSGQISPIPYHQSGKNGIKLSAAWLIDRAGCKAFTVGDAALWPQQPLVIINRNGNATGRDVVALERKIQDRVRQIFGVTLSPEVVHIAADSQ